MATRPRIVNFVSEVRNIGNLIAVRGIDAMLMPRFAPALRIDCRHFARVDVHSFDVALIGGAGLFHNCFSEFWKWLSRQRVPVLIWGVGVCLPAYHPSVSDPRKSGVPREHIDRLRKRLVFCNVRDDLTQEMYALDGSVTACPSVVYIQDKLSAADKGSTILYSHHSELVSDWEKERILRHCTDCTDNLFKDCSPMDVLAKFQRARLVVTTRLHGAIVAAALGRPYIALCRDRKMSAFVDQYGGGLTVESDACLGDAISTASTMNVGPLDSGAIRRVGNQANGVLAHMFG
jgi:hypothetical protein